MSFRRKAFLEHGISARWLDAEKATHGHGFAINLCGPAGCGLNEAAVSDIERLDISSLAIASEWIKARAPATGTVQMMYSEPADCVIASSDFLAKWQDILVACRDDAVVLHNLEPCVVFYCHEDELEFGWRSRRPSRI